MKYENVTNAVFLSRPNRFIAHVTADKKDIVCHVKNTGRCRELLVPGAEVYITKSNNPQRKTEYDLITVNKNGILINMDSTAPNKVAAEYLPTLLPGYTVFPERTYGDSRFDFYADNGREHVFIEVKGVTLEKDGIALFPDAPTQRGLKHLKGLTEAIKQGFDAIILFVVQMKGMKYFIPNDEMHKEFGDMLRTAADSGVKIIATECNVTPDSMKIIGQIPIKL